MAPPPDGAAPLPTSILHKKRSPRGLKVQLPSELEPEPEPEPTAAQRSVLSASPKDLARSLSEGKSSSPPASPSAGAALVRTNTKEEAAIMQGMTLLLHKKQGAAKPHSRFFWFEKKEGQPPAIYWAKKADAKRGHGRRKRAQVRAVRWGLGKEVKENRERALQRRQEAALPESVDERAFRVLTSVGASTRSKSSKQYAQLTLEADSPAEAELWVSGISQTLSGTLAQVAMSPSSSRGRTLTGKRRSRDLETGLAG